MTRITVRQGQMRRPRTVQGRFQGSPRAPTVCGTPELLPRCAAEDQGVDVNVTPDFDVEAVPLREYYSNLNKRLMELQELMGSSSQYIMPSNYEKYMHGDIPVGAVGNPLVSAKEYYEQLKQLRADSQVRPHWGCAARHARQGGIAFQCCSPGGSSKCRQLEGWWPVLPAHCTRGANTTQGRAAT
jgi:hypothetical protein